MKKQVYRSISLFLFAGWLSLSCNAGDKTADGTTAVTVTIATIGMASHRIAMGVLIGALPARCRGRYRPSGAIHHAA